MVVELCQVVKSCSARSLGDEATLLTNQEENMWGEPLLKACSELESA